MSYFVKATSAPTPKSKNTIVVSLFLAIVLLVMVVAQLCSYDKFIPLLDSYSLPLGATGIGILAGVIVFFEVLALPFLLRMKLSPAMRVLSMVVGWLVIAIWIYIQLWLNLHAFTMTNTGLLGASLDLMVGWWSVFFVAALGILAGWSAWGMWPLHRRKK